MIPTSVDRHELGVVEVQGVVNQTAYALAERLGIGVSDRHVALPPGLVDADPFERLAATRSLCASLEHHFGIDEYHGDVVSMLFGVPPTALKQPEHAGRLSPRQTSLMWGIERFAMSKRITARTRSHEPLQHPLKITSLEAAEIAVTRIEINTFKNEKWRSLHFVDEHSRQRLEIAIAVAPLFDVEDVKEFVDQHRQRHPSRKTGEAEQWAS